MKSKTNTQVLFLHNINIPKYKIENKITNDLLDISFDKE